MATPNLSVIPIISVKTFGESSFPAMMRRTDKFQEIPPDWDLWQKLYYKHPQAYLRQRLLAIKYLWEGKSRPEVTQLLGCNYKSLTKWIDKFLEGGLEKLTQPNLLELQLTELGIKEELEVEFIYTPPYSPNFNLVEYLIHQLRLQLLHHQPMGITIELVREKLEQYLSVNQLQTPQQIQNTIAHICSLAPSA